MQSTYETWLNFSQTFVNISTALIICDRLATFQVPTGDGDDTVKEGFVMFLSFAFFGALPLLG